MKHDDESLIGPVHGDGIRGQYKIYILSLKIAHNIETTVLECLNTPKADSLSPILALTSSMTSLAVADGWNSTAWYCPSMKWNLA